MATRGTAAYLRAHGLDVDVAYKINEGRPHVGDRIYNKEIALVINTPMGRESFFDDRTVRRAAMMNSVPCITTLTGGAATVSAIRALREEGLEVRSLQEYHAGAAVPVTAAAGGADRLTDRVALQRRRRDVLPGEDGGAGRHELDRCDTTPELVAIDSGSRLTPRRSRDPSSSLLSGGRSGHVSARRASRNLQRRRRPRARARTRRAVRFVPQSGVPDDRASHPPIALFLAAGLLAGAAAGVLLGAWKPCRPSSWRRGRSARRRRRGCRRVGRRMPACGIASWRRACSACWPARRSASAPRGTAAAPELAALAGDDPVVLEGVLRDDAVPSDFGVTCTLDVRRVRRAGAWVPMSGGVRLTIAGVGTPAARHAWRAGRLVRVTATLRRPLPYRNFGTPDQELRLAWRGIRLFGAVKSAALVEVLARGSPLAEATAAARAWARRTVAAAIGPDDPQGAAIVLAVLIGDRAGLSPDIEARMQRAGTYHVLAISGGNIAVLAAIVLALVGRIGLAPRPRAVVVLGVLALYAAAVVGGASVARATLAAAVYLSARALDLRTPAINAVAVTVALIVVASPLAVVDVGFWLTILASIAILSHAEPCARWLVARLPASSLPRPAAWLAGEGALLAGATIAAEGAVGPVTAYAFGQATLAGLVLNFAAVPLMTLVQAAAIVLLAAAAIHPVLAVVPAAVARWAAAGIVGSAGLVDAVPWSSWTLAPPPLWLAAAVVGAWWTMWQASRQPAAAGADRQPRGSPVSWRSRPAARPRARCSRRRSGTRRAARRRCLLEPRGCASSRSTSARATPR